MNLQVLAKVEKLLHVEPGDVKLGIKWLLKEPPPHNAPFHSVHFRQIRGTFPIPQQGNGEYEPK